MGLQALGDSSNSEYSNSTLNLSDKEDASHENSLEHIEIDTQIVKEDISVKVCNVAQHSNFIRLMSF
jgi:hypothetical protein